MDSLIFLAFIALVFVPLVIPLFLIVRLWKGSTEDDSFRAPGVNIYDVIDISLNQQIECARREVAMRERVYPGLVRRGQMTRGQSEYELAAMKAILKSLQSLADASSRQDDAQTA